MEANFHFHEWAFLAKVDPTTFERNRKITIDQFLRESSERQRRLGTNLQREIDAERGRAGDPEGALMVISRMMCERLGFLGEEMCSLSIDLNEVVRSRHFAEGT